MSSAVDPNFNFVHIRVSSVVRLSHLSVSTIFVCFYVVFSLKKLIIRFITRADTHTAFWYMKYCCFWTENKLIFRIYLTLELWLKVSKNLSVFMSLVKNGGINNMLEAIWIWRFIHFDYFRLWKCQGTIPVIVVYTNTRKIPIMQKV